MPDDTFSNRAIICPYCGYRHTDFCDYNLEDDTTTDFECQDCEKTFRLNVEVIRYYEGSAICES
jgi:DNA-directed RNA polymerase subunit RPC12/RpoP